MRLLTITIPKSMNIKRPVSTRIVALMREAIAKGLAPQTWADEPTRHHTIRLTTRDLGLLEAYMSQKGYTRHAATVAGLAYAAWSGAQSSRPKEPDRPDPFSGRPEQRRYYSQIMNAVRGHRNPIILAEGGTGIGKSRVLRVLADEIAGEEEQVIISAPTIQVMAQIASEFGPREDVAVLLGRGQFVDPEKLLMWLTTDDIDTEEAAAAQAWLEQGGPVVGDRGYASVLRDIVPNICYLFDDLIALCPSLSNADVCADEDTPPESPPMRVYGALRDTVASAKIVLCSHAALVMDRQMKRRGLNGLFKNGAQKLLIDEAHQLASTAENAQSKSVSLVLLRQVLLNLRRDKVRHASSAAEAVDKIIDLLRSAFPVSGPINPKKVPSGQIELLQTLLKKITARKDLYRTHQAVIKNGISVLSAFLRHDYGVQISYSPTRRWPSLMCGPLSLYRYFSDFWAHTAMAVLASGTLYLPGRTPIDGVNSRYISMLLHLPQDRLVSLPPVHTSWSKAYKLMTPEASEHRALTPPAEADAANPEEYEASMQRWFTAIAEKLSEVVSTARGGMLVLCTGYDMIDGIAEHLGSPDVVVQTRDAGFAVARKQFLGLLERGKRPIWLATGPAWTGLDIADMSIPPEEDLMLTDVVIPRVPFGTEHSTVHEHRKQSSGFMAEVYRAAFMFRQGMGRLMRREGVRHRRLWVLDARIFADNTKWFYRYFQQFLAQ